MISYRSLQRCRGFPRPEARRERPQVALLVDPALPPDWRDRGSCGRVGDLFNPTRLPHSATDTQLKVEGKTQ
jgi:hypothetical protein